jgi:hypothetical protein
MPFFDVSEVAKTRGWQPDQVKDLFTRYGIPPRSVDRSDSDWQTLERLLSEPPPSLDDATLQDLALILTDCRNRNELDVIKAHYGELAVKQAWALLTVDERQAVTVVAQFNPGDRCEVYFPDSDRWVSGYRYLEPSSYKGKIWLTDRNGCHGSSRIEWVRRAQP